MSSHPALRRTGTLLGLLVLLVTSLAIQPPSARAVQEGTVGHIEVERHAGASREATAIEVSKVAFPAGAPTVLLARSRQYADALVGAPLAKALGAPLLLTASDALSPGVADEITRLGATRVVILGGTNAVSEAIERQLARDHDVDRVAGDTRYATAVEVARELRATTPAPVTTRVFVTEGHNASPTRGFPDALSVAPFAAHTGDPIFLVTRDQLPAATRAGIMALDPDEIVVIGGPSAVGDGVYAQLTGLADGIRRIAGDDRYDTSAEVYDEAVTAGMDVANLWLATGRNFPDALAAGPAVAGLGHTMLLVNGPDLTRSSSALTRMQDNFCGIDVMNLLGGNGAIHSGAMTDLERTLPLTRDCRRTRDGGTASQPCDSYPATPEALKALVDTLPLRDDQGEWTDHDGDGFTTVDELRDFDPFAANGATTRNPLVADLPEFELTLDPDVEIGIELNGSTTSGRESERIEVTEDERHDTRQDIDTETVTHQHSVGVGYEATAGVEGKVPSASVKLSLDYRYTNTQSKTTGTILESGTRERNLTSIRNAFATSESITSGDLTFGMLLSNPGSVGYTVKHLAVDVFQLTPAGSYSYLGKATSSSSFGFEMPPNSSGVAIPFNLNIASSRLAQKLATDLGGLTFRVNEDYRLDKIGKGDARTDEATFAQHLGTVQRRTALVSFDYGPDRDVEDYLVSTHFTEERAVPLCQAVRTILLRDTETERLPVRDARSGDDDAAQQQAQDEVEMLVGMTTPTAEDGRWVRPNTDPTDEGSGYWIVAEKVNMVRGDARPDYSEMHLRFQDVVKHVFYEDADADGLSRATEERIHRTDDTKPDTDGDGLDDHTEVRDPVTVQIVGAEQRMALSDPLAADGDGDRIDDPTERANGTDPLAEDTDADTVPDTIDRLPLDPRGAADIDAPLYRFPLNLPNGSPLEQQFHMHPSSRGNATYHAFHAQNCRSDAPYNNATGPIVDGAGNAYAFSGNGGSAHLNDAGTGCGIVMQNYVFNFNGQDWGSWHPPVDAPARPVAISAWVRDPEGKVNSVEDSRGKPAPKRLVAGQPGHVGILTDGTHYWFEGIGTGDAVGDGVPTPPSSLPSVRFDVGTTDATNWEHVAVSAWELTAEQCAVRERDGVAPCTHVRVFVNGNAVHDRPVPGSLLPTRECWFRMARYGGNCGNNDPYVKGGQGVGIRGHAYGIDDVLVTDGVFSYADAERLFEAGPL